MLTTVRSWARTIKRRARLYLASRDPRVSWCAKLTAACVAAYALSPIDLIPDFIPVLGYLDDLILLPLGIALAVKMIPDATMSEHRATAIAAEGRPTSKTAAGIIVAIWAASIALKAWLGWRQLSN